MFLTALLGQLQKIGVLQSAKNAETMAGSAKRRSGQLDFSGLGPLKSSGTVGFSAFRDQDANAQQRRKARKKSTAGIDDSDEEEEESAIIGKMQDVEDKDDGKRLAVPEDGQFPGELADGVNRIHVCCETFTTSSL